MQKGKLIVISGIDGAGKTTLQDKLSQYLINKNEKVLITKQPTDSYRNNSDVRSFLDTGKSSISINTLAMLAATDRMLHIEKVIIPNLMNGFHVICDRYVYSTYAYFQERGADLDFVKILNKYVIKPDAGIFLKIDIDVAMARVLNRDGMSRKFEEKDPLKLDRIQNYLKRYIPDYFKIIEAQEDEHTIFTEAIKYLHNNGFLPSY